LKSRILTIFEIPDEEFKEDLTILSGMMPLHVNDRFAGSLILSIPLKHGLPILEKTGQWLISERGAFQPLLIKPLPFHEISIVPVTAPEKGNLRFAQELTEHIKSEDQRAERKVSPENTAKWVGYWSDERRQEYVLTKFEEVKQKSYIIKIEDRPYDFFTFFNCLIIASLSLLLLFILLFIHSLVRDKKGTPNKIRKSWKFQNKILALLLTISILVIVFWGLFSASITSSEMEKSYRIENKRNSHIIKKTLESRIQKQALELANHPAVHDFIIEGSKLAVDFIEDTDKNLQIFNARGNNLLKIGHFSKIAPQLIQSTLEQSFKYTFYQNAGKDLYLLSLVPVKVRPSSRINLGVLLMAQKITTDFCKTLAEEFQIDFSFFHINEVLASSRMELYQSEFLNTRLDGLVFKEFFLNNRETFEKSEKGGHSLYRTTFISLRNYEGQCIGVLAVPSLFQKLEVGDRVQRILTYVLGFVILWTSLVVSVGKSLSEKISSPLFSLIQGTRIVAGGKLGYTVSARATDEIQELVNSFNAMSLHLKEYSDSLNYQRTVLSTIVNNITNGVLALSSDNKIVSLNPRACVILGITDKWLHRSIYEGTDVDGFTIIAEKLTQIRRSREIIEREINLKIGEKESIVKMAMTRLHGEKGTGMPDIIVVMEDITELVQSKKWIAWGEMARQVAHEVKNPLTPMKLSAQYMKKAYFSRKENFKEIFTRSIDVIISQISHLDRLVRDFSLVASKSHPSPQLLNMNEILEEILLMYEGLSLENISIERNIEENLGIVLGVREEIRKILLNIIENAQQAIHGNGRIVVTARNIENVSDLSNEVEIEIEDNGEGILLENHDRLFNPEFSTKSYGTGLGLYITKNLVEKHNGSIHLTSTFGKGTKVTLRFPWGSTS
jgi:nitrogen-specific signal transduction histidine kinase